MNMTNKSNNDPKRVVSRLIHNGHFTIYSENMLKPWNKAILEHVKKCKHINCVGFNY